MEERLTSQADCILWWMRNRGEITPMDALEQFGCFRLSARIHDIKHGGMLHTGEEVVAETVEFKNVMGKTSRYSSYHIERRT